MAPIEKINDFLNCFFDTLDINDEVTRSYIRNGIINRYKKYINYYPLVLVNEDTDRNFIIKSSNGYYKLEDFLLNRLFQGLRYIERVDKDIGDMGDYNWRYRIITIAENVIALTLATNEDVTEEIKNTFLKTAIATSFDHELGHALKTRIIGGYQAKLPTEYCRILKIINNLTDLDDEIKSLMITCISMTISPDYLYKKLINNLRHIGNGKYSDMIISPDQLLDGYGERYSTGIVKDKYNNPCFELIDELLQEVESMGFFPIQDYPPIKLSFGSDGNYINVWNMGYMHIMGYGKILTTLLGDKATFQATYIDAEEVFEVFNKQYQDISRNTFLNDYQPIVNIGNHLYYIMRNQNEISYLTLDLFFARCLSQMMMQNISDSNIDDLINLITSLSERLTTNDDSDVCDSLPHNVVFYNLKKRLLEFKKNSNSVK